MRVRIASLLTAIALLLAAVGTETAFAASGIVFRAADVRGETWRTIEVPVLVENNSGFASLTLKLDYDNTRLKPISVARGELLAEHQDGQMIANLAFSDHELKIVYASSDDIAEDGVFALVTFELLVDRAFTTEIGLEVLFLDDMIFSAPDFEQRSGTLEIAKAFALECGQGTDGSTARWRNRTENMLSDVLLVVATYKDGRLSGLRTLQRTFAPLESFELSMPAANTDGLGVVKIFALSADGQPMAACGVFNGR